ncbi:hypothetical protein FN846DRAFT_886798 [Sphaerosporella brunnea]|uniref:Uncharacterized protein n=1 Tax=Sphaerosporella brunnea TaxID=1250544 RepID=A0A5J5F8F3_9PEZI|nr:hypothetical protein FN846DRAFT_886798 [Sphaerosporella brunnea]
MTSRPAVPKRTGDSPTPDARQQATKKARTVPRGQSKLVSPRKGRAGRDGINSIDPRASSDACYEAYVNPDSAAILSHAVSADDYAVGLDYFWAQLFTASRDFNPDERAELFRRTLPAFAESDSSETAQKLSERFEDSFHTFQGFFLERVRAYAESWLATDSGKDWIEARTSAVRRKSRDSRVPPNPAKPDDLLLWNGKSECPWPQMARSGGSSSEDRGEMWYAELTRIALELVRSHIIAHHARTGKKEIGREQRIFDLRRIMSPHAEALKATPRIVPTAGRPLQPLPPLESLKAARQEAHSAPPPKFDFDNVLKSKADLAGALPFPREAIGSARGQAEETVAEQREAFRAIYETESTRGGAPPLSGFDLPTEFYNPDDGVFTPKGDFIPTDSDQFVTDFAVAFAKAPIWEKAQLWDDYIAMELARIDSQMILSMARRNELVAIREKATRDYEQWRIQRQTLEQSYRDTARNSKAIADLRAKTGPEHRVPRGWSAQRGGNRFIPQNSPPTLPPLDAIPNPVRDAAAGAQFPAPMAGWSAQRGNRFMPQISPPTLPPLDAIPTPVRDAAAGAQFPAPIADRRGVARNVSQGHPQAGKSIPPPPLHRSGWEPHMQPPQVQQREQHQRDQQHQRRSQPQQPQWVPETTRSPSFGAWSKRSATPSVGQRAYSSFDSTADSTPASLTSSRVDRSTPVRIDSPPVSMASIMGGPSDVYSDDDRHLPNSDAEEEDEVQLPHLGDSRQPQGYCDVGPPALSDDIDEEQAIMSSMEAEKGAPADTGINIERGISRFVSGQDDSPQQQSPDVKESS